MKTFGIWTLTFLVIANMIGAGVFTTSGFSLADLGSPHLVVLAWAVGGAIAVAGAFSYGMLVNAMPESGGEYLFLSRAMHPVFGYIAGWVSLIAGFSGAIAFAATAFESYFLPERVRPSWLPGGVVAVSVIFLAGAFHGLKPRAGAIAQNTVVLLKLGLLATVLVFAATKLPTGTWDGFYANERELTGWTLASAFARSLVWISLSYAGFNAAVYVAGEVENAKRIVPKALAAGTAIVVVLYVLLNSVFVYASLPESIAGKPDVAAIAAHSLGGAGFETFVRGTIAVCLLTSVSSMIMAGPRVYAKMADDGLMPQRLRFQGDTPLSATALQVALAVALVLVSNLQGLLSYLGLTLSLSAAFSVCCLFLPSVRTRPLSHPLHLIPAFYVACTLVAAVLMTVSNPWQLVGTAITFFIGSMAYVYARFQAKRGQHTKSLKEPLS
jgi:APA family basic amino acid/polyamine antiporter